MKYYCMSSGNVYCGDRLSPAHKEIPPPPGTYNVWDGEKWVEDTAKKQADEDLILLDKMIQEEIKLLAVESLKAKGTI